MRLVFRCCPACRQPVPVDRDGLLLAHRVLADPARHRCAYEGVGVDNLDARSYGPGVRGGARPAVRAAVARRP
ncbi:MAG TPA: hypothetical protein VG276_28775 [Actinomycetes bacterium]|jgi:hypothetical protein|nr:hypothetical protein [Actinomycetes bacterium]